MAQLNFGETETFPVPLPYEWRLSQEVFRGKDGEEHFYARLTFVTPAGVSVTYLAAGAGNEKLANELIRLDRLNRKKARDLNPTQKPLGGANE